MTPAQRRKAFKSLKVGKQVGTSIYFHRLLADTLPKTLRLFLEGLPSIAGIEPGRFNVFKVDLRQNKASLLHYPDFWSSGFPRLATSWSLNLDTGKVSRRCYDKENPPILHRKELLLPPEHEDVPIFAELTQAAEDAGLFESASTIGRLKAWKQLLKEKEIRLKGHALKSTSTVAPTPVFDGSGEPPIMRHRTAITRGTLSAPMQALWRHGFLDSTHTVFDYGCGLGDDVRALEEAGFDVGAWDPHFRPEGEKCISDVVNIGFVINVIEDKTERREALQGAFALTNHVLAVATLIGGRAAYDKFRIFRDGVLTSRNTFQKYYAQSEFAEYVKDTLGREPVTIAPGVLFVFKTDEQEQEFLARRQRQRIRARRPMPRASERLKPERTSKRVAKLSRWMQHETLLEDFWNACLEWGRLPEAGEYRREPELRDKLGTPKNVLRYLIENKDSQEFEEARRARMDDTSVYLALGFFERRKSFGTHPPRTRRDIKAFWGSYKAAKDEAQRLLFSIADTKVIAQACVKASQHGLGYLDRDHSLTIHSSLVNELPVELRIYLGCASKLYGEVGEVDLIKLHIQSGKISLMLYDDFENKVLPLLIERVKINLRRQHIDFFDYGDMFEPQPLYLKSRFIYPSFKNYTRQKNLDDSISNLNLFKTSEHGPKLEDFKLILLKAGLDFNRFSSQ